jgi:hypothetical protein
MYYFRLTVLSISRLVDDVNIAVWMEAYTGSHYVMSALFQEPLDAMYTTL